MIHVAGVLSCLNHCCDWSWRASWVGGINTYQWYFKDCVVKWRLPSTWRLRWRNNWFFLVLFYWLIYIIYWRLITALEKYVCCLWLIFDAACDCICCGLWLYRLIYILRCDIWDHWETDICCDFCELWAWSYSYPPEYCNRAGALPQDCLWSAWRPNLNIAANIHLKTEVVITFYVKQACWDCPSCWVHKVLKSCWL